MGLDSLFCSNRSSIEPMRYILALIIAVPLLAGSVWASEAEF